MPTERFEEYLRLRAAIAVTGIETNLGYDDTFGMVVPSSGTAEFGEWSESEHPQEDYPLLFSRHFKETATATASIDFAIILAGDRPSESPLSVDFSELLVLSIGDAEPPAAAGADTTPSDEVLAVVDFARTRGFQEIADRLVELAQLPFDDDEAPLQAASAQYFVDYCLARKKKGCPLTTLTPAGEIDVTWKGPAGQSVLMRFFSTELVWVAYDLLMEKGSFETAAPNLISSDLHFSIPDWA